MVVVGSGCGTLARAAGVAALTLGALFASQSAEARGRVGIGINLGFPFFLPPPIVYAPPPAYYPPPPPVVYAPPPAYYAQPSYAPPPPAYAPPTAAGAPGQQCREYQSTAMINGQPQQTVGTACLQPDGTWRIIR
jgi:hypothetical protein